MDSDQDMKEKVHLVFASLFTDRAISYRHDRGGAPAPVQGPGIESAGLEECRLDVAEHPKLLFHCLGAVAYQLLQLAPLE